MCHDILPEGRLLASPRNRTTCSSLAGLRRAMAGEDIVEGVVLLCDADKGLSVSVGPYTGYIPRKEAALGLEDGRVREIAILSLVGKPVCFVITGISEGQDGPHLTLSRRRAQQLAWERLVRLPLGTVIPITVTHLEPFGAFVDMGCGLPSMIGSERISVARIRHPSERFSSGQYGWAVIWGRDEARNRLTLTHKELLGTWMENAAQFSVGMTVPGTVRGVMDYGLFVELLPNLAGLAEPHKGIRQGDRVSVYIKSLFPNTGKCKLLIIDKLPPAPPLPIHYYIPREMHLDRWDYLPTANRPGTETVFTDKE